MMPDDDLPKLSTNQKALKINLDPMFYGTFAEIGAGQEVARWFFKVGAAAGTISKSISAYDMAVRAAIGEFPARSCSPTSIIGGLSSYFRLQEPVLDKSVFRSAQRIQS